MGSLVRHTRCASYPEPNMDSTKDASPRPTLGRRRRRGRAGGVGHTGTGTAQGTQNPFKLFRGYYSWAACTADGGTNPLLRPTRQSIVPMDVETAELPAPAKDICDRNKTRGGPARVAVQAVKAFHSRNGVGAGEAMRAMTGPFWAYFGIILLTPHTHTHRSQANSPVVALPSPLRFLHRGTPILFASHRRRGLAH